MITPSIPLFAGLSTTLPLWVLFHTCVKNIGSLFHFSGERSYQKRQPTVTTNSQTFPKVYTQNELSYLTWGGARSLMKINFIRIAKHSLISQRWKRFSGLKDSWRTYASEELVKRVDKKVPQNVTKSI